ncbi:TPA: preprotein translocase subunit SecE [Candidatus Saccharibacteria bacterium]|nr:MAG: hypothetical protein UX30_C0007G0065 [Candidatus Saccharibacteria bacterium GW2011_GWA2_46_10]OGL35562.1 MAG: preprotein translocase subunit SecE [Candidatus Saccharibacteria bacterium RIFCSPHIGHO2_12_FULL_47_17]HCM51823.1 preprotein translocase subunit SecE [Candidatus Saccharibacteria bacterium]
MADIKPRIRKAPTVRETVETKSGQDRVPKAPRFKILSKAASGLTFLKPVFRALGVILLPIKKILGWLVPRYFVNAWHEVKQVTWTTRRETWRLTFAVFLFALIFGSLIAGVDKVLDEFFKKVILK